MSTGYTAQKCFTLLDDSNTLDTTLRSWIYIWFSFGAGDYSLMGWGSFCLKEESKMQAVLFSQAKWRSLCSSLPTELMVSQNFFYGSHGQEIRNCFQEHKIGCCLIFFMFAMRKREATETMALAKPWTITLCANSNAGSWSVLVQCVQMQSIYSAGIATCMCKITSELATWVLNVTIWSVEKISTWKGLCGP